VTQSMTGFARASVTTGAVTVTVECRSVNNRYLDLHFRMPDNLRSMESVLRTRANEYCSRGKLEFVIRAMDADFDAPTAINATRLSALQGALGQIENAFPAAAKPDQLALLLAPGVMVEQETDPETLRATAVAAASGEKLADMIRQRADVMRGHLQDLREQLPELQTAHRQRLLDRLTTVDIEADPVRLEEEIVYILQRADVEEEMDRLEAHLDAIETALAAKGPCGRRLDFLMQELNREANTLGSKSTALSTTNVSVEFKVLIEQMREQIQNIE
jgi:uncharacterized protein (TIGR00255 family)